MKSAKWNSKWQFSFLTISQYLYGDMTLRYFKIILLMISLYIRLKCFIEKCSEVLMKPPLISDWVGIRIPDILDTYDREV